MLRQHAVNGSFCWQLEHDKSSRKKGRLQREGPKQRKACLRHRQNPPIHEILSRNVCTQTCIYIYMYICIYIHIHISISPTRSYRHETCRFFQSTTQCLWRPGTKVPITCARPVLRCGSTDRSLDQSCTTFLVGPLWTDSTQVKRLCWSWRRALRSSRAMSANKSLQMASGRFNLINLTHLAT